MQSKTHSFLESCVNVAIGYSVAVASQIAIFPMFNIHIPVSDNLLIGVWFTVISLLRSYTIRRWFTKKKRKRRIHAQNNVLRSRNIGD